MSLREFSRIFTLNLQLMKTERLLGLFLFLWGAFCACVRAEGTHGYFTTTQAGELAGLIAASASDRVDSLTVSGPLGGADLAVIVSEEGKLADLTYVDLTGVELVDDGEAYRVVSPEAIGMYTCYYYYSEDIRSESHALQQWTRVYTDDLSYLFFDMDLLTEVRLPAGLPAIGTGTFRSCNSLRAVGWSGALQSIGAQAFVGCSNLALRSRTLQVGEIGSRAFSGCTSLADTLWLEGTSMVAAEAFSNCDGLACVVADKALERVGYRAFINCFALDSLLLPEGLAQVGEEAFAGVPWYDRRPVEDGVRYVGGVAYELMPDALSGGTVTLREGTLGVADKFFAGSALTHVSLPSSLLHIGGHAFESCFDLTSVDLPDGLESIGEWCFFNCPRLSEISLPASLAEIGTYAFNGCTGLSCVAYDAPRAGGEYLFSGCSGLTEVTLGQPVRVLPAGIFSGCSALQAVKGGENLEEIGTDAFYGTGLSSFVFPSTLRLLGSTAFARTGLTEVVLPESLDSIGGHVFSDCKLERLSVNGSPARMDAGAFYGCEVQRLEWNVPETEVSFSWGIDCKEAVVGSNVRTLPGNFLGNSDVASVTFEAPSSLSLLPAKAFYECRSLVSVTLPASLKSIGDEAFRFCSSLQTVTQEGEAAQVRSIDGGDVACIGDNAFYYCSSLRTVDLPDEATYVGESAFYHCGNLQEVKLPAALEEIRASAFQDCTGLQEMEFPEGMTAIGEKAFYRCTGLKRLGFPTTLASIGTEAFSECTGLEEIDCPIVQPIPINITEFWNVPSTCVLNVPEGSRLEYADATRWNGFDIKEVFVSVPSVELSGELRSVVRPEPGGMTLTPVGGQRVAVYTVNGRCMHVGTDGAQLSLPSGVYIVRIGERSWRVLVE